MNEKENFNNYIRYRKMIYQTLMPEYVTKNMISEANWMIRSHCRSAEDLGIHVRPGDICYMDFGQAYLNEMGYQHFGLVISVCCRKALVIPMTSNPVQYRTAYDVLQNPGGKIHLMRLGKVPGLNKPSVLFLNDAKYVNTARVIDIKAHINVQGELFQEISDRMEGLMFRNNAKIRI